MLSDKSAASEESATSDQEIGTRTKSKHLGQLREPARAKPVPVSASA